MAHAQAAPTDPVPFAPLPMSDGVWARIVARDGRADGAFVFAVRTTGIYCRPSCPARRPHRKNALLYGSGSDAGAAGFRACLRCTPDEVTGDETAALVARACRFMARERRSRITLSSLARSLDVTQGGLRGAFVDVLGVTPADYLAMLRSDAARARLAAGETVRDATYSAGFRSPARAYSRVAADVGMSPGDYKAGGAGKTVQFATTTSDMGVVLVARTERGVCAVRIGDDAADLTAGLQEEFHAAKIEPARDGLKGLVAVVVDTLSGRAVPQAVPLDVAATAFRRRVFAALQEIPVGQTRTYAEIAQAVGAPGAARAVGSACAANPVAGLIPCHRVVRGDGGLGGYRWGVDRKKRLLDVEREARP